MIAVLIGKNVVYKTNLPKTISGNYTINDKNGKKLINIQSRNGEYWKINSTNHVKIVNPEWLNKKSGNEEIINSVVLKEYNANYILFSGSILGKSYRLSQYIKTHCTQFYFVKLAHEQINGKPTNKVKIMLILRLSDLF